MKMQGMRKSIVTRLVSAAVSWMFLFTTPVAGAAPSAGIDPYGLSIPENLGKIKEIFVPSDSSKIVIHIQDAHVNYGVQKNIDGIIRELVEKYEVPMVSVEGGDGTIDVAQYSSIPLKMRNAMGEYFIKEGFFTGADAAALSLGVKYVGAETNELYAENAEVFRAVYAVKEKAEAFAAFASSQLEQIADKKLAGAEKDFVAKTMDYKARRLDFSSYASFLAATSKAQGLSLADWANFSKLVESIDLQNEIDYAAVETERAELLKALESKLPAAEMKVQVDSSLSYRMGKMSGVEYYTGLKAAADKAGVWSGEKAANVASYLKLLELRDETNSLALFDEAAEIEAKLADKVLGAEAKRIYTLASIASVLEKYPSFQLTKTDVAYFNTVRDEVKFDSFRTVLREHAPEAVTDEMLENGKILFENLPVMEKFYKLATARDEAMVANTLKAMGDSKTAILVAGGFHTSGIKEELRKAGVGYVVISPRVTTRTNSELYIRMMTGKKDTPDEAFVYEFLADENKMASGTVKELAGLVKDVQGLIGLPEGTTEEQLAAVLERLVAEKKYVKTATPDGTPVYTYKGAPVKAYSTVGIIDGGMVFGNPAQVQAEVAKLKLDRQTTEGVQADRNMVDAVVTAMTNLKLKVDKADVEAAVKALSPESRKALQAAVDAGFMVADLSDMDTAQFITGGKTQSGIKQAASPELAEATLALVVADETRPIIALMNKANANEAFDAANMIEEIIKVNALKNGNVDAAYEVSGKALSEAQVALKASSLARGISDIQDKLGKDKEASAVALEELVKQFNKSNVFGSIQERLLEQIREIALELEGEVSVERIENLHQIVADLDAALKNNLVNINDGLARMAVDDKLPAVKSATTAEQIAEQKIFMDRATYNKIVGVGKEGDKNYIAPCKSRTARAYAAIFANNIVEDAADFATKNANGLIGGLIVDPENTALVNAARTAENDIAVSYVANENIQSMELMDLALLAGRSSEQIRKIFFQQLDPQVQLIYAAVYGDTLMDIINDVSNVDYQNVDVGSIALQIQIRSEVAAAIKA